MIKAADGFKDKTTAINSATTTQNNLPSDFILAYAPASEGQSLQGREPKFSSNRRLNGSHAAWVHALESSFWSAAMGTAQGGRSRNAKRPGALTGIDLAESADCPCDVIQ